MATPNVFISGLGPAGAVFATLCGRLGLSVKVIDIAPDVYDLPRAIVMDYEVMRQMQLIGCADGILRHSQPGKGYDFLNAKREILTARPPPPGKAPTGFHFANLFHQPSMERTVRKVLFELPNVEVELGTELIAIDQDETGVRLVLRKADGSLSEERADFAVGCDGGRSLMRRYLDIQMEDLGFDEPWVVVDVKLKQDDVGLSDNGVQLCDPRRPTTCVPSGPRRRRWEFMLHPGETAEQVTHPDSLNQWISEWVDPDLVEIERSAVYQFHGLVAKTWRRGRAMIIGDAAHQMPPFMGQGLCAGARDAFNLAWKLSAVVNEKAPIAFLDSLEAERSPHVKEVTKGAIAMGKTVCVTDPEEARIRDEQMMADHKAGKGFAFPGVPRITSGVLSDSSAGAVFPEAYTGDLATPDRVDDQTGYVPLLVVADAAMLEGAGREAIAALQATSPDLRVLSLYGEAGDTLPLIDANGLVALMIGRHAGLLVKPDRIVFGAGSLDDLAAAWRQYLSAEPIKVPARERVA